MSSREVLVVKYGSDSVTGDGGMDEAKVAHHVEQLVALHPKCGLIVVSSGAVAVGRTVLPPHEQTAEHDLQSLAMAGSAPAFTAWQKELLKHGVASGQLLITHREINDKQEGSIMQKALQGNLDKDWITVVNENDALSINELRKLAYGGDNDGLARHIATATKASKLLLLTNEKGLLDESGSLVVSVATPNGYDHAQALARGGMLSKVEAAWAAAGHGIDSYIGDAMADIADILSGVSTYFPARSEQ